MIFLKQFLKANILRNDIHQIRTPIEERIASNNVINENTENRVLRLYNNASLEGGLKEYRDPELKEFRLEMLTLMESLENKFELKLINKFKPIKEEML